MVLVLLLAVPLWAQTPVPGRLLVHLTDPGAVQSPEILNAGKFDELEAIGVRIVNVAPGAEEAKTAEFLADPGVDLVEQDYTFRLELPPAAGTVPLSPFSPDPVEPNDPYYPYQWAYPQMDAPDAWGITRGSPDVRVAVIDTGICLGHPDLAAKVVVNVNFSDASTVDDFFGHGTHVAGIVAAVTDNDVGVAGTDWKASLMNVKVGDDFGVFMDSSVVRGIVWAALRGANVINMSFGGPTRSEIFHRAIQFAARSDVILVAAAGNAASSTPNYPAAYPEVISVGGTDENDQAADFSSYGSWVNVAAPAVNIFSTAPTHPNALFLNTYGYLSGTSMSSAFVSGEAALLLSLQPHIHRDFTDRQIRYVRHLIESTTDDPPQLEGYFAHGRIDLFKAASESRPIGE
jgi:thermitase